MIRVVAVHQQYDFPRDQKDAKFLACSLAASADHLITGDGDFKDAYRIGQTKVLSVTLFKAWARIRSWPVAQTVACDGGSTPPRLM